MNSKYLSAVVFFVLVACTSSKPMHHQESAKRGISSINPEQFLYEFALDREAGERYIPEDNTASEQQEYQRLINLFSAHFKNKYGDEQARAGHIDQGEKGYALRGVHAKGHGCLTGTFIVEDHGKPEFQYGVFKEPKNHEIIIRYSNGDGPPQKDNDKTISIGMAFKLLNVKGPKLLGALQTEDSADFLMTNHSGFIVSNIQEFAEVIEGREKGLLEKIGALKVAAKGLYKRMRVSKRDPLVTSYWGNLPFKMGNGVVKYLLRPELCQGETNSGESKLTPRKRFNPDFLSDALTDHIRRHNACFGFYLQKKGTDEESPVEDAAVSWPEKGFITRVASLQIPVQEPNENLKKSSLLNIENYAAKEICQNLSFSPWNTTADFKPLSSLNRARRVIYELSVAMRRDINHAENPAAKRE